jgi:hypothetical protein
MLLPPNKGMSMLTYISKVLIYNSLIFINDYSNNDNLIIFITAITVSLIINELPESSRTAHFMFKSPMGDLGGFLTIVVLKESVLSHHHCRSIVQSF